MEHAYWPLRVRETDPAGGRATANVLLGKVSPPGRPFKARWALFSKLLPPGPASDKNRFLSDLTKLNHARNRVMHPSKGALPHEGDFRFVHEFMYFIDVPPWSKAEEARRAFSGVLGE
jgi:hypothetical protein